MAEYFDSIYRHWDEQLRGLQAQRMERAKEKHSSESAVVEVVDDDGDLVALESESLEQAKRGIVIEGIIVIDLVDSPIKKANAEEDAKGKVMEKDGARETDEKNDEGSDKVNGASESAKARAKFQGPRLGRTGREFKMNIDMVLNPPGLPPLSPHKVTPAKPNDVPQSAEECDARMERLQ